MEAPNDEVRRLRRTMRELAALSAVPAAWAGEERVEIAGRLAEMLLTSLELDFVFVCLRPSPEPPFELALTPRGRASEADTKEFASVLMPKIPNSLAPFSTASLSVPAGTSKRTIAIAPLGVNGELGFVAVGAPREDFPNESARILLSAGANQATVVLQRRQAELPRIRESEWFRVTLSSIGDAVITTDAAGRVTFLNAVASELTGWSMNEAAGQPLTTIFRIINESTRETAKNPVDTVLSEGRIVGLANHTLLIAKDGRERPIDDSAAPIRRANGEMEGVVLIFRDVTEQRERQRELAVNEARKTAILESALDGIVTCDHQGRVIEFNPAAEQIFGFKKADILGHELAELIVPPILRERHRTGMTAHLATGQSRVLNRRIELPALRADGTEFPVEIAITRISTEGQPIFTAHVRDISEKVRQDKLRNARLALTQIIAQATDRREAIGALLMTICQSLSWDIGLFWVRESESDTLRVLESWKRDDERLVKFDLASRDYVFREGEGFPGFIWEKGKAHWILDYTMEERYPRVVHAIECGLHGTLACPIIVGDSMVGVMEFFSHKIREPDAHVLEMLDTVAGQIGQFLQRLKAEELNRRSEERFRLMADSIPQLAWIAKPNGDVIWYNQRWYDYTGATKEEVLGTGYTKFVDPEALPQALSKWQHALETGEAFDDVFALRRHDGAYRPHLTRAVPLLDAEGRIRSWFGTNTDITEQKALERALRDSEQLYRKLGESIPYGVWINDPRGRNLYASESFLKLVGLTQEECSGDGWSKVLHPDDLAPTLKAWQECVASGGTWDVEHRYKGIDGNWHPILARGLPVRNERGEITAWAGINLDISQMKDAEQKLRDADRRKDEFLALLAHELRNPLAPLHNALELMRVEPNLSGAEGTEMRRIMEDQVHHMIRLVDDLLDISRISSGKIELRQENVELGKVAEAALEASRFLIEQAGHELILRQPAEPLIVHGDASRLMQVFANLLSNAAKYTPRGGRVTLALERDAREAVVRVKDTGVGIPPEMLLRVFDIFTQVDSSITRSQGGLGIGLTLVKQIVEMHGGSVTASSAGEGRGSEFILRLPLAKMSLSKPTPPPAATGAINGSGRNILIVDDSPAASHLVRRLLETLGHKVRTAANASLALEYVAAETPDIIFSDIAMPHVNGYELAQQLRSLPGGKDLVLVAVTGYGQAEDKQRALDAGFDHHFVKPIGFDRLKSFLASIPN